MVLAYLVFKYLKGVSKRDVWYEEHEHHHQSEGPVAGPGSSLPSYPTPVLRRSPLRPDKSKYLKAMGSKSPWPFLLFVNMKGE